ncbi:MAG: PAS domain-containing protein [Rhodobacteraceae bacterium]|nr:PAS domain-containing protein [Paracoccaceae bacterium]
MDPLLPPPALLFLSSLGAAILGLGVFTAWETWRRNRLQTRDPLSLIRFVFDGDTLRQASPDGERLLKTGPLLDTDWQRLAAILSRQFPGMTAARTRLVEGQPVELISEDRGTGMILDLADGLLHLGLSRRDPKPEIHLDRNIMAAMEQELETQRAIVSHLPIPIWREDGGQITWANGAYLELATLHDPKDRPAAWPPPRLLPANATDGRQKLDTGQGRRPRWVDLHSSPMAGGALRMALPADAAVRAETRLDTFIQTLTKTFAGLTVGLAVFDRERLLVVFNPALSDLTSLPVDFLAARPTLFGFLERLGAQRIADERQNVPPREMVLAFDGDGPELGHSETWKLVTGQTYRLSAMPQPDGALTLLIEDISAEVSLNRRYRGEIALRQGVIDSLDEAMAIFSEEGELMLANAAYARLWGSDPNAVLGRIGIEEATRLWHLRCKPTDIWADIRDQVAGGQARRFGSVVELTSGERLDCRVRGLGDGLTLVSFHPVETPGDTIGRRIEARLSS